jgi:hypothetical protein
MSRTSFVPSVLFVVLVSLGPTSTAWGQFVRPQENRHTLTQQGFRSQLPVVQEIPSRPQIGPEGIDAMFRVSNIDGEFEVIAAQSRFLILKRDLARDGKVRAMVAVGNVGIIDFDIIHSRLIRVVGRRVGSTDLTIMTDNNEIYTLRVHVVYDLETLRGRLSQQFPATQIPLRQSRETLTLTGEARDPIEERNALRGINSLINAEQSILLMRSSGGGSAGKAPPVAPQAVPDR